MLNILIRTKLSLICVLNPIANFSASGN